MEIAVWRMQTKDEHLPHQPMTLCEAREVLAEAPFKWWIAGGWALDLYLKRETRPHADVDVALLRRDQELLHAYLRDWEFEYVDMHAEERRRWLPGEELELPIHEIWARRNSSAGWELEFVLNESDDSNWIFRRDRRIRLPLKRLEIFEADGMPLLPPEVVLLYKSNRLTEKNQHDFDQTADALDDESRQWLARSLARSTPPHPWLSALRT